MGITKSSTEYAWLPTHVVEAVAFSGAIAVRTMFGRVAKTKMSLVPTNGGATQKT